MKKVVVGKYESVIFPEIGAEKIKVKIDTGARTSSIHSGKQKQILKSGKTVLECTLLGDRKTKYVFEKFEVRKIKSSNGIIQSRYVVKLKVELGGKIYYSKFSLAKRSSMSFPVLIGRSLLRKGYIVDVSAKYLTLNPS